MNKVFEKRVWNRSYHTIKLNVSSALTTHPSKLLNLHLSEMHIGARPESDTRAHIKKRNVLPPSTVTNAALHQCTYDNCAVIANAAQLSQTQLPQIISVCAAKWAGAAGVDVRKSENKWRMRLTRTLISYPLFLFAVSNYCHCCVRISESWFHCNHAPASDKVHARNDDLCMHA